MLIKYAGKYVKIYFIIRITFSSKSKVPYLNFSWGSRVDLCFATVTLNLTL